MDLESDYLEEMKGMIIDVLAMVFEPAIKTYAKAREINKSHQASLFIRPEIKRTECDHAVPSPQPPQRDCRSIRYDWGLLHGGLRLRKGFLVDRQMLVKSPFKPMDSERWNTRDHSCLNIGCTSAPWVSNFTHLRTLNIDYWSLLGFYTYIS